MNDERPRGPIIPGWTPPPAPDGAAMSGRYVELEPLDAEKHAALLFAAFDGHDAVWDYMPAGPFASAAQFHRWMRDITVPCGMSRIAAASEARFVSPAASADRVPA